MRKFLIGLLSLACTLTAIMGVVACGDQTDNSQESNVQASSIEQVSSSKENVSVEENSSTDTGASNEDSSSEVVSSSDEENSAGEEDATYTKGLEFKKIDGKEEYMVQSIGEATETDIVIPATCEGLPVTTIGYGAFYYGFTLTSVVLPDSITSIQSSAFTYCEKLQFNEYENCKYLGNADNPYMALVEVADKSGESYKIHENTKIIADSVFANLDNLMTVVIPDSVQTIGAAAFYGSTKVASVTLGKGVKTIGERAFALCYDFTSIELFHGVTTIGKSAFYSCESLESIVIPSSVTTIEARAFEDCDELNGVYITDIAAWCNITFGDYANPLLYAGNLYLNNVLVTELVIPNTVTELKSGVFNACQSLKSVVISNNVTKIGNDAFMSCFGLESVVISGSVTEIGELAFYDCSSLTSIEFKGTVEQWNAIIKGSYWNDCVPATEVVCSDGKATP